MAKHNYIIAALTIIIVLIVVEMNYIANKQFNNGKLWMSKEFLGQFEEIYHMKDRDGNKDAEDFIETWKKIKPKLKSKIVTDLVSTAFRDNTIP
jgi:hypothetical protein